MPLTQLFVDEIRALREGVASAGNERSRVIRLAERAARSAAPVLIEGEAGTGGDALARALHECGDRKGRPFLRLHAASLAEGGANPLARALEAQGGTLLLQAAEDLGPRGQAALLRLIQDGELETAGGRVQRLDLRVIATSHAPLLERVRQARFREDLYYRLHVLPITLQPLRMQATDIPGLARLFAAHFAAEEGKRIAGLCPKAEALLVRYAWPGNLRQLEAAVLRAVALAEGEVLGIAEFPQIAACTEGFSVEVPPAPQASMREVARLDIRAPETRHPHMLPLFGDDGEMRPLEALEADIIRFALEHYRGHMSAVSRRLGIGRSTLYRKLKDLGLEDEPADAAA